MLWEDFINALLHRTPPHLIEHIHLVFLAMFFAILVSFPAAVIITREKYLPYTDRVLSIFNVGQTVPPLAVISIFLPFLGVGTGPAVFALTIYALLPIARNTVAGLASVPTETKEAALGMGMQPKEVFLQVELPLCLPVILAGVKTSAVLTIGTATLAALVGAGGLGAVIFAGINFFRAELILAGTVALGAMALAMDRLITLVEVLVLPPHLR